MEKKAGMNHFGEIICIGIINYINIIIWYLGPFFLMKCRFRLTPLRVILFLSVQFLLVGLVRYILPLSLYPRSLIETLIVFVPMFILFTDALWKRAVVAVSSLIIIIFGELTTDILIKLIGGSGIIGQDESAQSFMMGKVLWVLTAYTLTMCFIVFYRILVNKIRIRSMLFYIVIPVYQIIMLLMYYYNCWKYNDRVITYGVSFLVLGLGIDFLIIYFQRAMEKNLETRTRLEAMKRQREYELAYYRQVNQSMEQMRAVRHDFMNQIRTARQMIQTRQERGKIEKLLKESEERLRGACTAATPERKEEWPDERI